MEPNQIQLTPSLMSGAEDDAIRQLQRYYRREGQMAAPHTRARC